MTDLDATLGAATEHHRAGRIAEAERLYREILVASPGHPDALHLLGIVALQSGRTAEAAELLGQAVEADPQATVFHANRGHALHALGRAEDAALSYARALAQLLVRGEDEGNIGTLAELIRRYDAQARRAAADLLEHGTDGADPVCRRSLLFNLTGDVAHYRILAEALLADPGRFSLPSLHYTYWGMAMQLFLGSGRTGDVGAFVADQQFRLHRLLVSEAARQCGAAGRLRPADGRAEVRRIAIVTNQMLGGGHQPTFDAFDYARLMQDSFGREVVIVNTNSMALERENGFVPAYAYNLTEQYKGEQVIEAYGARVRMVSFPEPRFDAAKVGAIVDWIEAFDPDAIVAFGGSNVIADLFAGTRAVVCVPTSAGNTLSLARLVLGYGPADTAATLPGGAGGPLAGRFRPFAFGWTLPPSETLMTRGDLGLPDGVPLFVVVGNRLDSEVDDRFLTMADAVLDRVADAWVVFAGAVDTLTGRLAGLRNAARMVAPGHVDDIRALYRLSTALLNPQRQGGGGSAAFALAEGLPVVTLPGGDVANVAGPAFIVTDEAAFAERCSALATDAVFRDGQRAEARHRFADTADRRRSVERLLAYCQEAQTVAG